jgi:hypothetical protein
MRQLLNFVVDKLDDAQAQGRGLARTLKLDAKSFPALFKAELESDKELHWKHLETMQAWGWIRLKLGKPQLGLADYERNPRLEVVNEAAIRGAVGRTERNKSAAEVWREAVFAGLDAPETGRELVARYLIEIPGRSAAEVVARLNGLRALADEPLLLREVSARLFWGQSKILDGRQPLVSAVLGTDECPFPEMPVQLQVFLPEGGFDGVLFIENLATFEKAMRERAVRFQRLALVFASGFKGSAARLRSSAGASVYFASHGTLSPTYTAEFLSWLWGGKPLPSWFWGDLDFSGMRILAALRKTFPGLEAWQPGYGPMLVALQEGDGHQPSSAGKDGQGAISATGCPYADSVLLPAIAQTGLFADQEMA